MFLRICLDFSLTEVSSEGFSWCQKKGGAQKSVEREAARLSEPPAVRWTKALADIFDRKIPPAPPVPPAGSRGLSRALVDSRGLGLSRA